MRFLQQFEPNATQNPFILKFFFLRFFSNHCAQKMQITRLELCALEVFLRRRTESGDADKTSPPSELSAVLLGSDLADVFPEARVERVSAGGVLPPI